MATPDAPDEESEYEVDFTSEQAGAVVICKRCDKEFPPGTKLRLLHSKNHGFDRFVCNVCLKHYRNKDTTVRRPATNQGMCKS